MQDTEQREKIVDRLGDLVNDALGVAVQGHALVRHQIHGAPEAESRREIHEFLKGVEPLLYAHVEQLRDCLKRLRRPESTLKAAVGTFVGAIAGWMDRVRSDDEASLDLRDDYAALALCVAATSRLHAAAVALGDPQTAELALSHLDALRETSAALLGVVPGALVRELSESLEGIEEAAADEARRGIDSVWGSGRGGLTPGRRSSS